MRNRIVQRIHPISKGLKLLALLPLWAMPAHAAITYDLVLRTPGDLNGDGQTVVVDPGTRITDVELVLIETVSGETASIFGDNTNFPGTTNRNGNLAAYQADLLVSGDDGTF